MDLGGWLRSLGLGQYEAAFRENAIDDTVLPSLTAEDLKDLGVGIVGHRRKLLDAIAALRADASTKAALSDALPATDGTAKDTAERRHVTVMFSDLVGSTALSARMDPEDLREVISTYQKCAAETVRRFDGFVAQYLGDGVLVYFGYPQAHEDDAERAVRAGLDLIAAVVALKTRVSLQARVGIATGLVVVGDLLGAGDARERGIVGETPNLAARLQGIAEPNTVVIAEATRKLLGNLFELEDLGARDLKGIAGPVRAWAALRASSVESRFEALHTAGLTALVGRQEESELLLRRWSRAKSGEGQVVLLSGEAGIGKSRLTVALLERLAGEPHTRLRYVCSPQHTDSALYPIIGQMERAAGLAHDDTTQAKLDKLAAMLAQTFTSIQDAALFAEMLSLPNDGRYPAFDELAPEQRRQRTLEALIVQMQALARQNPVLMIFEDAHWADPTSLDLFGRVVDRIRTLRVLLIVTFRPEFGPPWIGRPHVTALTINRLTEREIDAMIDRVVGSKRLPPTIREDIIERTDGIPLFVEEMTTAVLEAESEGGAERVAAAGPLPALAVPASLHASLMARLDRLGPAKEVAQIGAAIGREFAHALLAAVVHKPERELGSALDRLIAVGLLFREGVPPHANYLFKHALVQDAAYGTLLRAPRQNIHARIAKVLEQQFSERASVEPELFARHLTEAGQVEAATSYWLRAGHRAAEHSADEEAVRHLRRGLEMLMTLPDSTQRDRQELDFQLALGTPLAARHGYGTPPVGAARDRAIALCEKLGDTQRLLPSLYGQFAYCLASGMIPKALEYAERCQSMAAHTGDRLTRLIAHRAMGSALLEMGEFEAARAQLNQLLALHNAEKDRSLSVHYVADPYASGLAFLAVTLWALGYPDQAVTAREKAFKCALDLNHANTSGFVSIYAGAQLSVLLGHMEEIRAYVENLNARSGERMPFWAPVVGHLMIGWAVGCAGQLEHGIALMKKGIDAAEKTGGIYWPHYHSLFAILQARAGNRRDSLSAISKAKELIAETGEYFWHADVLRIEGELGLLFAASAKDAEACFVQALEVARRQQAKSFELRAATSLGRLWRGQGNLIDARNLLAPIHGWFTEGFDTLDLKQANALLEELA